MLSALSTQDAEPPCQRVTSHNARITAARYPNSNPPSTESTAPGILVLPDTT